MPASKERIDELEVRYSHLQSLLEELNSAVVDHERRLTRLEQRILTGEKLLLELRDQARLERADP